MSFPSLTLSDFFNFPIGVRKDGSCTPVIDTIDGVNIGLAGFSAHQSQSDMEIREDAFAYYKSLMHKLDKKEIEIREGSGSDTESSRELPMEVERFFETGFMVTKADAVIPREQTLTITEAAAMLEWREMQSLTGSLIGFTYKQMVSAYLAYSGKEKRRVL